MDVRLRCNFFIAVVFNFASVFLEDASCQVYSWNVAVPLNMTVCTGSSPLNLNWTFSPETPDPLAIEWLKQATSGTFDSIAIFARGNFTPTAAYAGKVMRTGSTAEIAIQGPLTAADRGLYSVSVTDGGGLQITNDANVIVPVVIVPIRASCQGTDAGGYTVTCSIEVSPPVTLQLRNSTDVINSGSSVIGLQKTISNAANLTFQCSVTGDGSECVTPNTADVTCEPDLSPSTPSGSTTPSPNPDDICKDNKLCYLFALFLLIPVILIGVLVWWCRRKKKDVKSVQANETKMTKTKQSSVQQRQ